MKTAKEILERLEELEEVARDNRDNFDDTPLGEYLEEEQQVEYNKLKDEYNNL